MRLYGSIISPLAVSLLKNGYQLVAARRSNRESYPMAGIIRALLAGEENARLRAAHWLHERGLKV